MKRLALPLFSCLLVLTLLLGSFRTANAAAGDPPVVTPVSGDTEFTTEIIPIASLPGTTGLANQMLFPVEFPLSEKQFEGAGILVKGMDSGKATACFNITGTEVGWGVKLGLWDRAKWVLLPTSITPPTEIPNSFACATITGSGTYAFIRWVTDPDKLPVYLPSCGDLTFAYPIDAGFDDYEGWMSRAIVLSYYLIPYGTPISFQLINVIPSGFFTAGTSGSRIVSSSVELVPDTWYVAFVDFEPEIVFEYDYWENF